MYLTGLNYDSAADMANLLTDRSAPWIKRPQSSPHMDTTDDKLTRESNLALLRKI